MKCSKCSKLLLPIENEYELITAYKSEWRIIDGHHCCKQCADEPELNLWEQYKFLDDKLTNLYNKINTETEKAIKEECTLDKKHCECVPWLREKINRQMEEIEYAWQEAWNATKKVMKKENPKEEILYGLVYPSTCLEFVTLFTDETVATRRCDSLNEGEKLVLPGISENRWSVKKFIIREA